MGNRVQDTIDDSVLTEAIERQRTSKAELASGGPDTPSLLPASRQDEIVAEIRERAGSVGLAPNEYLNHQARTADVGPPENGACLWSGWYPNDEASTERDDLSNRWVAEAWASRQEGVTTLEQTPGGGELDAYRLWDLDEDHLNQLGLSEHDVDEVWSTLSERYANSAEGDAAIFAGEIYPGSVLGRHEAPTLRSSPEVGADSMHFAYPCPRRIRQEGGSREVPEQVRAAFTEQGNQARLQLHVPTAPGYVDLDHVSSLDDDALRAHLANLREEVDETDQRRAPNSPDQPAESHPEPEQAETEQPETEQPSQDAQDEENHEPPTTADQTADSEAADYATREAADDDRIDAAMSSDAGDDWGTENESPAAEAEASSGSERED